MANHPYLLSLVCLVAMWGMALLGVWLRGQRGAAGREDREDLVLVVSATLTLLGLIIGFTFSMASTRYDQRKLYEEEEANAIGTEYVRADFLSATAAAQVKQLLVRYLDRRIAFYESGNRALLMHTDEATEQLQAQLWQGVRPEAGERPSPVMALVVSGMNDVLNSQGYTQFSWWNRIPAPAWGLMIGLALFSNALVGYATGRSRAGNLLLLVLPVIVSISFFLIADIDSPRQGVIRVLPVDLISLSQSLHASHP